VNHQRIPSIADQINKINFDQSNPRMAHTSYDVFSPYLMSKRIDGRYSH